MSTDISVYLELLVDPHTSNPWWDCVASNVRVGRSYLLFGIVADVRSSKSIVLPIASARGLPADASDCVLDAWHEYGGNNASFLTYRELLHAQELYANTDGQWYDARWVAPKDPVDEGWRIFAREQDVPPGVSIPAPPVGHDPQELRIAVRLNSGKLGPHKDVAAILAYLGEYERREYSTRMVFWFDN